MAQDKSQKYTTFTIVRHGETEMNRTLCIQGHADSPLSEQGVCQAQTRMHMLKDIHFDHVCCSDLSRAKRTAEILTIERKLAINTTQLLRERGFGAYEGRPIEEFLEENKALIEEFERLTDEQRWDHQLLGNVEKSSSVIGRLMTILREIAVTCAGKSVLIVTHAGAMRLLLIHLGWATYEEMPWGTIDNCALMQIESDGIDFFIKDIDGITKFPERIPPRHTIL